MHSPSAFSRRVLLRAGAVGIGGLPLWGSSLLAAGPSQSRRADACILLYMDGGPSHLDLWDPKPAAPVEVRGPWGTIATSVPGIRVGERLPLVGNQMHRLVQIRSMCHAETVHDPAVYQMLTGVKHVSSAGNLTVQPSDAPQLGAAWGYIDRQPAVMPKVVDLPETMKMEARVLPGQSAGYLGGTYNPFSVAVTPAGKVLPPVLSLPREVTHGRFREWSALVSQLNRDLSRVEAGPQLAAFREYQEQAVALLDRPSMEQAFDLDREPAAVRARYGENRHGQSVLLARRLVEAGSRFVTVYWGKEQQDWADGKKDRIANNPWDTHRNHFPLIRDTLAPRADRALAALVADLAERGRLERTLVVWMGDFGRTPKIDKKYASRDHWPFAFTVVLAGAGLPGGTVYGQTDRLGAEVTLDPATPADLTATIYSALGADPATLLPGPDGKQIPLSTGRPLTRLWS